MVKIAIKACFKKIVCGWKRERERKGRDERIDGVLYSRKLLRGSLIFSRETIT